MKPSPSRVRSGIGTLSRKLRTEAASLGQRLGWAAGEHDGAPAPSRSEILPPLRLLGVGHSHLIALAGALAGRVQQPGLQFRLIQMIDPAFEPSLEHGDAGVALNRALQARLRAEEAAEDAGVPFVFDCVSGNEYHFLGLVNHPRRFDFVLADAPELPLIPGAEIVPARLMRERMHRATEMARYILAGLRAATPLPIWHLQSPPPVPDADHIRQHPSVFGDAIAEHGVAPPALRWKLWRLQSETYRTACAEMGIGFVPVPEAALDADGFLRREGWNLDPTHANAWYGAHVLDQVEALGRAAQRRVPA